MTSGVYAVTNTVNGARYIGSTKDFSTRRTAHLTAIRTGNVYTNSRLAAAVRQYGAAAFTVEMIEDVEPLDDALEEAERRWIAEAAESDRGGLYNVEMTGRRPRAAALCRCYQCAERREARAEGEDTP